MARARYRTLAVVGAVLIAGCSGLLAPPAGTRTPTATPAPVPTQSPTATPTSTPPSEVAPGLSENDLVRPRALVAAHVQSLNADRSFLTAYALRTRYVERYPNGTVAVRVRGRHTVETPRGRHRLTWAGNASRLFDVETGDTRGEADTYCEIGRCLLALTTDNATTYGKRGVFGPVLFTAITKRGLGAFLASAESSTVRAVEQNGTTHYRLQTVGVRDSTTVPAPERVAPAGNVSFTALVAPSGFIRRYRLAYTGSRGGTRVHVTETVRFTSVDGATVDRPPWVDEAEDATGDVTATARHVG